MTEPIDFTKLARQVESGCGAVFPAAYPGTCLECGGEIYEGDLVGYLDDEVVCADGPDSCYQLACNS